jgi:hypothetical protein
MVIKAVEDAHTGDLILPSPSDVYSDICYGKMQWSVVFVYVISRPWIRWFPHLSSCVLIGKYT